MSPALNINDGFKDAPFTKPFGLTSQLVILEFLINNKDNDYTLRELEENIGINHRTIDRAIIRLLEFNMVTISRSIGQAHLYKYNSDSFVCDIITPLHEYIVNTIKEEKNDKGSDDNAGSGGLSNITI